VIRVPARLDRIVLPAAILAIVWAHRALLFGDPVAPSRAAAERWLFAPEQASPLVAVGLAAWLLWCRRERLASCPGSPAPALASGLVALAIVVFVQALRSGSVGLLAPALSLEVLGLAAGAKGRPGMRVVLLPAVVVLLAMPIPPVLHNELVWRLQIWTTAGTAALLSALGFDVQHADAMIRIGDDHALVVVEACSGLRGIQILLVVGLVVRELFSAAGARAWIAVVVAPALAGLLHVVRVASIALTDDPEVRVSIAQGHLVQGLTVTLVGTIVLYGLGLWISRGRDVAASSAATDAGRALAAQGAGEGRAGLARGTLGVVVTASIVSVLSILPLLSIPPLLSIRPLHSIPPLHRGASERRSASPSAPRIELTRSAWTGTELEPDWLATGELPLAPIIRRRYERPTAGEAPQIVDLFVAYHDPRRPADSPFSSKLIRPGPDWSLIERRRVRIWPLDRFADLARVRSGSAQAVVYHWHLRDEGRMRSVARSLFGLGSPGSPGSLDDDDEAPGARRAVVRLATPLEAGGPLARDRAKRVLDQFIDDFIEDLERL
jgi:exosortase